jgi:hypothetical protein
VLNPQTKNYSDFVSLNTPVTSFRPVGIAFNQNEGALYIACIGKVEVRTTLPNDNNNNSIHLPEPVPWHFHSVLTKNVAFETSGLSFKVFSKPPSC